MGQDLVPVIHRDKNNMADYVVWHLTRNPRVNYSISSAIMTIENMGDAVFSLTSHTPHPVNSCVIIKWLHESKIIIMIDADQSVRGAVQRTIKNQLSMGINLLVEDKIVNLPEDPLPKRTLKKNRDRYQLLLGRTAEP